MSRKPNILFVMTDQQRFDSIAALGNSNIYTPNLDRLVARGVSFSNAYSPCPVCVAARYVVRTGCLPPTTRVFSNTISKPALGQDDSIVGRCGNYIAQEMASREYRTFGIGKFHTQPWDENLGYQSYLRSEELYANPDQRQNDDFAGQERSGRATGRQVGAHVGRAEPNLELRRPSWSPWRAV